MRRISAILRAAANGYRLKGQAVLIDQPSCGKGRGEAATRAAVIMTHRRGRRYPG